jgi:DNA polymerase (family 10)
VQGSLTPKKSGRSIKSFVATKTNVPIDLYLATPETWATLILIRTGSKAHNVRLAQRARELGFKLRASGDGIEVKNGQLISVSDEREVFSLLGLPYVPPEHRD